ncbi:BglG family transcription antiterminator [Neobacillus fumarioli]|uniref:BglG family transcription antiterminator n=1 Tax=Neobacillus fumarioli TaxID=105229 RepID=UPI00082DB783|nr:BglG family transcription antiterminator [Neobacillus fumarioli]
MYITSREKAIIELIIKTSGKHTAASIAKYLNVSVRTVHRDLNTIEKTLESFGLRLNRNPNQGLMIEGKYEQLFRLMQYLTTTHPIDQTPLEKKLLLLLSLFEEESYKIQALANDLGISVSTLTAYLDEITDWLRDYNILITRKRGVGVELFGKESDKRHAMASYFLQNFNEELIERLFLLEKGEYSSRKVLGYFKADYLLAIDRIVHQVHPNLADSDYLGFIVHLCITMQRTEEQFLLEERLVYPNEISNEYHLIIKICQELELMYSVSFTKEDMNYLAVILKGSKLKAVDAVPYDSVVLSRMIKNVIQDVSTQLNVDMTKDFSLYQGLLAHMEPALFRLKQQMGMYNPLTEEIQKKYPVLFMAVRNSLDKEFKEIGHFSDDEIAFVVLHFGSALVMYEEDLSIKALVVCPTGIGTSKMLASRIKQEISEIDSVKISSIKEIQQHGNLINFDIIISTVRLPFINIDYVLVSPLLNEENIQTIRSFLRENIENLTKTKQYLKTKQKIASPSTVEKMSIMEILQELKDIQRSIESVLSHFRVYSTSLKSHDQIIKEMVRISEKEKLLSNSIEVIEALKNRERQGGLGIPNTEMGLFHCRHKKVNELIFKISSVKDPVYIKGMDNKDMPIRHVLLLLAPEELSVRKQEIISLISTSLIESNEAIMIYSSGNEDLIRQKLESIFLDYLHHHVIKE